MKLMHYGHHRYPKTATRKAGCPDMSRLLRKLRKGKEASKLEQDPKGPSSESSLMMKTRLGLTKSKYTGMTTFMRMERNQKAFVPSADMIAHHNRILPKFTEPNHDEGYLFSNVSVREMISNNVMRIMELEDVRYNLNEIALSGIIDCAMHAAAGPDFATGFSHFNQA